VAPVPARPGHRRRQARARHASRGASAVVLSARGRRRHDRSEGSTRSLAVVVREGASIASF
jgi:hypothetical protein